MSEIFRFAEEKTSIVYSSRVKMISSTEGNSNNLSKITNGDIKKSTVCFKISKITSNTIKE